MAEPSPIPIRRDRPFSILDGMILVAATGIGLALGMNIFAYAFSFPPVSMWIARPFTYFLLAWTLAFLPIRLRRPRPSRQRLFLQPGMAACSAVALITTLTALFRWAFNGLGLGSRNHAEMLINYWVQDSHHMGTSVAVTWLGLLLSRRWRPERTWIDRLGRFLGCLWLLALLCDWRFGRWNFNLTYLLLTNT